MSSTDVASKPSAMNSSRRPPQCPCARASRRRSANHAGRVSPSTSECVLTHSSRWHRLASGTDWHSESGADHPTRLPDSKGQDMPRTSSSPAAPRNRRRNRFAPARTGRPRDRRRPARRGHHRRPRHRRGPPALVEQARELTGGRLDGVVACAGVRCSIRSPSRSTTSARSRRLEGLRPLLAAGTDPRAVVISSVASLHRPIRRRRRRTRRRRGGRRRSCSVAVAQGRLGAVTRRRRPRSRDGCAAPRSRPSGRRPASRSTRSPRARSTPMIQAMLDTEADASRSTVPCRCH